MEDLVTGLFSNIYSGKKVLITGHSGFKGTWLTLWLQKLGSCVTGISLPPETEPSHWNILRLDCTNHWIDIRNADILAKAILDCNPDIIFHLAAQPLVRRSYKEPAYTWQTNVTGTVNVLEAARNCIKLKAVVCITTDKCYENREWVWGYRESDRLGGHDPYSASKAASEIAIDSYRKSFFNSKNSPLIASARAGNVIGGGDWSNDRLIPDLVRAVTADRQLLIRSPESTRPWQHVLESLYGYLLLGQKLLESRREYASAWNFGPDTDCNRTVAEVLSIMKSQWPELSWQIDSNPKPHEAGLLYLDSSMARSKLGWQPVWNLGEALEKTSEWYRMYLLNNIVLSVQQLDDYCRIISERTRA